MRQLSLRDVGPLLTLLILGACATAPAGREAAGRGADPLPAVEARTLTIGVTSTVRAFGLAGATTGVGGWMAAGEIHSQGLITSDFDTRKPIGRLAVRAPSFDDGSISLLADGRMRVAYQVRQGVSWHDGTPFTARDLAFSYAVGSDPGLPAPDRESISHMDAAEAPDLESFVITFKGPYYLAGSLGIRAFYPYPEHLLRSPYERYLATGSTDEFINLSFWTSDYTHLGPFRVVAFDPGDGITLRAYDGYFLGRPKIDTIRVQSFGDENALFAHLLAGTVQLFFGVTLNPELGAQLRERWDRAGDGTVHPIYGYTRFMVPQWRAGVQRERAVFDLRVRAALYHALDRESISDAIQSGRRELVANAVLPPDDRNFEGSRDGLRQYTYSPDRAGALLREAGWGLEGERTLRHESDGRRFQTAIWANSRWSNETALLADAWRKMGLEVEEFLIPGAMTRNPEARAAFPGWETTSRHADSLLRILEEAPAGPDNRWTGNGPGYENPHARGLVEAYRRSIGDRDQVEAVRQITRFMADELPLLPLYFEADTLGVRRGVKAFDDPKGGAGSGAPYGFYSRNSHLWEIR